MLKNSHFLNAPPTHQTSNYFHNFSRFLFEPTTAPQTMLPPTLPRCDILRWTTRGRMGGPTDWCTHARMNICITGCTRRPAGELPGVLCMGRQAVCLSFQPSARPSICLSIHTSFRLVVCSQVDGLLKVKSQRCRSKSKSRLGPTSKSKFNSKPKSQSQSRSKSKSQFQS